MSRYFERLDNSDTVNYRHHVYRLSRTTTARNSSSTTSLTRSIRYQHYALLSHPRVTTIRMEEAPDDTAFSSGRQDDIATSSPFTPLLQLWTYHWCDLTDAGPSHLTTSSSDFKMSMLACRAFQFFSLDHSEMIKH